jgi:GNAT superfamily N-acetyltransferase
MAASSAVQIPAGVPAWVQVFTAAERPDYWAGAEAGFRSLWPEYNHHGTHSGRYFGALVPKHADLQVLVVDARVEGVVARGRTIPFRWDGSMDDLPRGIDAVGLRAVEDTASPTALSALAAEVDRTRQGQGLSRFVIEAMVAVARARGLGPLVAPVRPSWKYRYPITPIDHYMQWRRDDALPFDPWMRVHARLSASIVRAEPKSMEISWPVSEWAKWTGMQFPEDGEYVIPGGLAPLSVKHGIGHYWEPNVWMLHAI